MHATSIVNAFRVTTLLCVATLSMCPIGCGKTGAAVGATVGTVRGGRQQRKSNAAAKDQAAAQGGAQVQQQYQSQKAAYDQQMNTFKRAFSACMDARGYSVK